MIRCFSSFVLVCLALVALTGCGSDDSPSSPSRNDLIGTWIMRSGSTTGTVSINLGAGEMTMDIDTSVTFQGDGNTLTFSDDDQFSVVGLDALDVSGSEYQGLPSLENTMTGTWTLSGSTLTLDFATDGIDSLFQAGTVEIDGAALTVRLPGTVDHRDPQSGFGILAELTTVVNAEKQ